jgi:HEAT repeat protein
VVTAAPQESPPHSHRGFTFLLDKEGKLAKARLMTKPLIGILTSLISCCMLSASPAGLPQADSRPLPSNDTRARAILTEGLDSNDFAVRIEAITAASMVGSNEAMVGRLEEFLKDKNVQVRLATIHALADLKSPQIKDGLRKTLEEDNAPEVLFAAAKVLAGLEDPAGTMALMDVYDRKRKTRSSILEQKKRSFLEEFHSPQSALIFILTKGIGYVPVPGAGSGFSAISELLKDPGLSDRAEVLFVLSRTKSQELRDLLVRALHDDDWSVRAAATQIVAQTARAELRESLLPLFEDKNQKVRLRAAGAYLHLSLVETQ